MTNSLRRTAGTRRNGWGVPRAFGSTSKPSPLGKGLCAVLLTLFALAGVACGGDKDKGQQQGQGQQKDGKPAPPPEVFVETVTQRDVPIYSEWIGTTAGDIDAVIRPQITGYLLRRVYQEGSFVHKGDVLFEIDPRQFRAALEQAQATLGQGQASLVKAQRDVARYRPLAAQHAISQQDYDNAVTAEQVATANTEAQKAQVDQARLNLEWTRVTSPISGVSGVAVAQVGDLVTPQTELSTVSRVDPLRVQFNLGEQEYLRYQEQSQADPDAGKRLADLQMVLSDGKVFPAHGRLIFTDREVNARTGTIGAVGLFPNPGNLLRPGQYARVRAQTDLEKGAILVPQRAVNELQGGFQVAVVAADGTADVRNVKVGPREGSLWVIDQGLKPGEQVIVAGFSRAKSGSKVTPKPAPPASAAGSGSGSGSSGK